MSAGISMGHIAMDFEPWLVAGTHFQKVADQVGQRAAFPKRALLEALMELPVDGGADALWFALKQFGSMRQPCRG